MPAIFTTREIAELLGAKTWRVRRLFESGRLPEPPKFGGKRAISREMIPAIVDALRERNWLPNGDDHEVTDTMNHEKRPRDFGGAATEKGVLLDGCYHNRL